MGRLILLGATGVFGSLLERELRSEVVVASRATGADLRDPSSIARVARGAFAVLCAAGPFQSFDPRCVRAVVEEGAHWLDIADDPAWFFGLLDDRELDARARERGVAVVSGLSTLPAISGMLVRSLISGGGTGASPVHRADRRGRLSVTLGIGNRNAKGAGAIASAMSGDGRTIFTPDRELFRREGLDVRTFVKFQLPGAAMMFRIAKRLGVKPQTLGRIAKPISRFGTDASYVEAIGPNGSARIDANGQRLAIVPIAAVAHRLLASAKLEGVLKPYEAISDEELLNALRDAGASSSGAVRTSAAAPV